MTAQTAPTIFAYSSDADPTTIEDPLGNPISVTYNAQHLPLEATDARGVVTKNVYDARGNAIESIVDYGTAPGKLNLMTMAPSTRLET